MAIKFPLIGVHAIVEGANKYFADLDKVNKTTADTGNSLSKTAQATASFGKVFTSATSKVEKFGEKIWETAAQIGGSNKQIDAFLMKVSPMQLGLGAVAAGATAAATAFVALGQRGAALPGLATSFDNISASVGQLSTDLLGGLRAASAGTISDFALMQRANQALSGASGQLGVEMGKKLPDLLAIARTQAKLTGQSIDFLFESLILGIRKGSPLRIDNANLIISEGQAYAEYARQIGVSVEAMTAEQKSIAVLNATLAAGNIALMQAGNIQETNADKTARMNAIFTNLLDTLAVGVQPAFGKFLDVINRAGALVGSLVTAVNPLISSLLEVGASIVTGPLNAILALLEPLSRVISFLITFATVLVQPVLRAVSAVGSALGEGFTRIIQWLSEVFANNFGINFDNVARTFGYGAGAIIGTFGNALMSTYNAVVAPVVLAIATAIASFLVGESPPPKGPLSQIDRGGAAVMAAWAEGFAGASLQPVEEVAAEVNRVLGNIGAMSMPMVEARLAQLDAALQPFNDQLAIVKANFDAISEPAKAALDAIDRQMGKAMQALAAGEAGSAEKVRALDAQREKIEEALFAQQDLTDQAQIQQALAKAQQGEERALLTIQQARLKAAESLSEVKSPAVKEATEKAADAAKGAAKSGEEAPQAGGTTSMGGMGLPSVADMISGQSAVNQMSADLSQGWQDGLAFGLGAGTQSAFDANNARIGEQVQRIQNADIGARIANAFSGIGTRIQGALSEAAATIGDWIDGIVSPNREGSIPYSFNALINGDWAALTTSLTSPFTNAAESLAEIDWTTILSDVGLNFETFFSDISTDFAEFATALSDPTVQGGMMAALTAMNEQLPTFLQPIFTQFTDAFTQNAADVATWLSNITDPSNMDSIPGTLALLPTRITNALRDLGSHFETSVWIPISDTITTISTNVGNFFTGSGEGTLSGILDAGVAWFTALPQRIFDALAGMGGIFYAVIVTPMIGAVNQAIEGIETFINNSLSGLGTLIGSLSGLAEAVGFGAQFAEIQGSLAGGINLPRISPPSAPAAVMPGAARGGIFSGGMFRAGERGTEIIANAASKTAVFPANVTRNLDIIGRVLAQPSSMELSHAGGYGSNTVNNDRSMTNNFYGVNQPEQIHQRINSLQSVRGLH